MRLDAAEPGEEPKWIQVAAEGEYRGHHTGVFKLDAAVFEQVIANFRAHPAYRADDDGVGCEDVIPFDWRHASEDAPGDIHAQAAHAWARELEVRRGADGKLQLWALTRFLEHTRQLIKQHRIKWTSVALWPEAKDPRSGANVGWYLSSIAFTNDPFIQGMVPVAAARAASHQEPVMNRFLQLAAAHLKLSNDIAHDEEKVGAAVVKCAADYTSALQTLSALEDQLGTKDPKELLKKLSDLFMVRAKLDEVLPQLEQMKEQQAAAEEQAMAAEVDSAIAAGRARSVDRSALLFFRKHNPEGFKATYTPPPAPVAHLTQAIATPAPAPAAPAAPTWTGPLAQMHTLSRTGAPALPQPAPGTPPEVINLDAYEGRNAYEKAMSYVRSTEGGKKLSFDQVHEKAGLVLASLKRPTARLTA